MLPESDFGVYIHIPFCQTKCNYCSFVTRPWNADIADRYCRAVVRELEAVFSSARDWKKIDTIYFGGGTPSLVPESQLAEILATCRKLVDASPNCEISLEANPGTLTPQRVEGYREMGINRISMGAQTFDDQELVSIGRTHDSEQISESMDLLRTHGFENLNLDVMLGLPQQSPDRWSNNLHRLTELAPPHISVYMLDLDRKVPLYHSIAKGLYSVPDEEAVADLYLQTLGELSGHGYQQYEISNFAFSGYQCRHNLKYWRREPVLGFGVASHSFDGLTRYANFSSLNAYLNSVESRSSPIEWRQTLSAAESLQETLFLGLRLNQGVDWKQLAAEFGWTQLTSYEPSLRTMSSEGLVEWKNSSIRLTPRGMLLSNEVFRDFV